MTLAHWQHHQTNQRFTVALEGWPSSETWWQCIGELTMVAPLPGANPIYTFSYRLIPQLCMQLSKHSDKLTMQPLFVHLKQAQICVAELSVHSSCIQSQSKKHMHSWLHNDGKWLPPFKDLSKHAEGNKCKWVHWFLLHWLWDTCKAGIACHFSDKIQCCEMLSEVKAKLVSLLMCKLLDYWH